MKKKKKKKKKIIDTRIILLNFILQLTARLLRTEKVRKIHSGDKPSLLQFPRRRHYIPPTPLSHSLSQYKTRGRRQDDDNYRSSPYFTASASLHPFPRRCAICEAQWPPARAHRLLRLSHSLSLFTFVRTFRGPRERRENGSPRVTTAMATTGFPRVAVTAKSLEKAVV